MNRSKNTRPEDGRRKGGPPPSEHDSAEHEIAGFGIDSYQEIKRQMATGPCTSRGAPPDDAPRCPPRDSEP